jgi:hypothetical protein
MKRLFARIVLPRMLTRAIPCAVAAVALSLSPARAEAKQGEFGLGFIAGDPSGLSGKLWLGPNNALDFIAGFSILDDRISLNADYVWHEWGLIPVQAGKLPLYYGMGVGTSIAHSAAIGVRGVVGLEYIFPSAPLDAFVELGPGANILPSTDFTFSGGIGMRFFF